MRGSGRLPLLFTYIVCPCSAHDRRLRAAQRTGRGWRLRHRREGVCALSVLLTNTWHVSLALSSPAPCCAECWVRSSTTSFGWVSFFHVASQAHAFPATLHRVMRRKSEKRIHVRSKCTCVKTRRTLVLSAALRPQNRMLGAPRVRARRNRHGATPRIEWFSFLSIGKRILCSCSGRKSSLSSEERRWKKRK